MRRLTVNGQHRDVETYGELAAAVHLAANGDQSIIAPALCALCGNRDYIDPSGTRWSLAEVAS